MISATGIVEADARAGDLLQVFRVDKNTPTLVVTPTIVRHKSLVCVEGLAMVLAMPPEWTVEKLNALGYTQEQQVSKSLLKAIRISRVWKKPLNISLNECVRRVAICSAYAVPLYREGPLPRHQALLAPYFSNYACDPNARMEMEWGSDLLKIFAVRDIPQGTPVTFAKTYLYGECRAVCVCKQCPPLPPHPLSPVHSSILAFCVDALRDPDGYPDSEPKDILRTLFNLICEIIRDGAAYTVIWRVLSLTMLYWDGHRRALATAKDCPLPGMLWFAIPALLADRPQTNPFLTRLHLLTHRFQKACQPHISDAYRYLGVKELFEGCKEEKEDCKEDEHPFVQALQNECPSASSAEPLLPIRPETSVSGDSEQRIGDTLLSSERSCKVETHVSPGTSSL